MPDFNRAVFLSYASQDADAARRICEALRAAGVEVWFDQSELRGGDAWDEKIRRQIKECALFVPVISATTQARHEGYFRLEWRLADQRTHLMGKAKAFLVPVCIDDTRDIHADVPDSFVAVHWTRLPAGETSAAFCDRVKTLLVGEAGARLPPAAPEMKQPGAASLPGKSRRWLVPAIAGVAILIALGIWQPWKKSAHAANVTPLSAAQQSALNVPAKDDKSIAVLPFANLSDDKENTAFFSDGMHEDILTSLANIRDLRVISRTSVMDYRGTTKKIPQIARELGVAYILDGSVRRAGNQVRITGQLIRAANDEHLWAKSYDRDLTPKEMFAIQAALATEIAGALHAAISPEAKKLLNRRPPENLAAYDLFLKARTFSYINRAGAANREKFLREAVELDPNFAEAWGELAVVHSEHVFRDFDHSPERLTQADAAIGRAVRLAPDSAEILRLLGIYAYAGYRDYARATDQFEKVIRLQPNNVDAIHYLGAVQRRQGRWIEALGNYRKAAELDPRSRTVGSNLAFCLILARRWVEAIAAQRRISALWPDDLDLQIRRVRIAFLATGSTREADDWLVRLARAQSDSPQIVAERKYWAEVKGDYAEWKRLDALYPYPDEGNQPRGSQAVVAAMIFAAHGDMAGARARLGNFPAEARSALELEPANARLWGELARMEALLGQNEQALRDAGRAVELMPETLDALEGARHSRNLAVVYAWTGNKDQAIAELVRLLRVPVIAVGGGVWSVHSLGADPEFAPLRGDPRFEALLKDPKNHAPLF